MKVVQNKVDVSFEVKLDKKHERVYLAPQMKDDYKDNIACVHDITVDNHQMVVLEWINSKNKNYAANMADFVINNRTFCVDVVKW